MTKTSATLIALAAALTFAAAATSASAQEERPPAYAAARAAGQVGERVNGMLGIVGTPTPELERLVNDINNRRRMVYVERAQAQGATLEQYGVTAGCLAIARTSVGEKYQAPDGTWQTRTSAPPIRDPRCP